MATYYVDSGAGVLEYSAKTWAVGDRMVPAQADASTNHLIAKQWVWQCTTGGTSTAIPTWPASVTDDVTTVTDGGVVWTARAPDNWADAMPGLYWLCADNTTRRLVAGDTVYIKNTHNRVYTTSVVINYPGGLTNQVPIRVLSVDASLNLLAGATEETSASNITITLNNAVYCYGLTFRTGDGAFAAFMGIAYRGAGGNDCSSHYVKCSFINRSNGLLSIGSLNYSNTGASSIKFTECIFTGTRNSTVIQTNESAIEFVNCVSSGAMTNLFRPGDTAPTSAYGCDFSVGATNLFNLGSINSSPQFLFSNCKIPSSLYSGSFSTGIGVQLLTLYACSNTDNVYDFFSISGEGTVQDSQSYYLTTGGSQSKDQNGSLVSYSITSAPTTDCSKDFPLYTPWVSKFISATGSKTISMKIAYDSATALKDTECWIEVEYYGDASSPLSTVEVSAPVVSGTKSRDILAAGTNLADTSEGWTGTFTNKKTATLSKTVTIAQQGYVRCRVAIAKQQTIYVDNVIWVA